MRWADAVAVEAGEFGARDRRLYDHELVYILEGEGEIVLDGRPFLAPPDHLFLVQPRVWHSFRSPKETQRLLGVHFDWEIQPDTARFTNFRAVGEPLEPSLFRSAREIEGWHLTSQPFLDLRGRPRVRRALEHVVAEHNRADQESSAIAGALLAATLGHIAREVRLLGELSLNQNIGADAVRRVQRARELLEAPRDEPISIDDLARAVGWSGDHLRRMFRAVLNASPLEIQTAARVRRAQELLRYGGFSIGAIAQRCGFDDASHFTRVFKKSVGHTPREWLALNRSSTKG